MGTLRQDNIEYKSKEIISDSIVTSLNNTQQLLFSCSQLIIVTGTATGQIIKLPDTATLTHNKLITIVNRSSQSIAIQNNAGTSVKTILANSSANFSSVDNTNNSWMSVDGASLVKPYKTFYVDSQASAGGDGSFNFPFTTLSAALAVCGTGAEIIVAPGGYSETTSVSVQNISIMSLGVERGVICHFTGTLTFAHTASSIRLSGLGIDNLVHSDAGSLYVDRCIVGTSFVKSGTGYLEINSCDTQGSSFAGYISVTGASNVAIKGGYVGALIVNNSSCAVSLADQISATPITLTSGTLVLGIGVVYSASGTSNALTATGGTLILDGVSFLTPSLTVARINIGASVVYDDIFCKVDTTNSTFSGTRTTLYTLRSRYLESLGSGDMTKAVYDTNNDGIVDHAHKTDILNTARNINGVAFDGSADITVYDSTKQAALGFTPENVANKGNASGYASLDSSSLVPIVNIPPAALEKLITVADQTARYALTTASVHNGYTVKQVDTGILYFVKDDTNLNNSSGYEAYTASSASSCPWSGITGIPTANTSTTGIITSTDWNTFNNKAPATLLTGATSSTNGVAGLVPAPTSGQQDYFLKGDGTWYQLAISPSTITQVSTLANLSNISVGGIALITNATNIKAPVPDALHLATSSARTGTTTATGTFTGSYGIYPNASGTSFVASLTSTSAEYNSSQFSWDRFFLGYANDQAIAGTGNTTLTLNISGSNAYISIVSFYPSRTSGTEGWGTVALTATYADATTETKTNTGIGGNVACNFSMNAGKKAVTRLVFVLSAGYGTNAGARGLTLGFFNGGSSLYPNGVYYKQSNTGYADTDLIATCNMKATGFVNSISTSDRVTNTVILDNIAAGLYSSGNRSLVIWCSTSTTYDTSTMGVSNGGTAFGGSTKWTPVIHGWSYINSGMNFGSQGDIQIATLHDVTNSKIYRITLQIGEGYINNFVSIERLA